MTPNRGAKETKYICCVSFTVVSTKVYSYSVGLVYVRNFYRFGNYKDVVYMKSRRLFILF